MRVVIRTYEKLVGLAEDLPLDLPLFLLDPVNEMPLTNENGEEIMVLPGLVHFYLFKDGQVSDLFERVEKISIGGAQGKTKKIDFTGMVAAEFFAYGAALALCRRADISGLPTVFTFFGFPSKTSIPSTATKRK